MKDYILLADKVVEMKVKEKSLSEIRDELGVSNSFISSSIRKSGLKFACQRGLIRRTTLNEDFFQEINTPEKAYWLGVIASDGHITKNNGKLAFSMKEDNILLKLKDQINSGSPVVHRKSFHKKVNKYYDTYSFQICSKKFCSFIINTGIDHFKSYSFAVPKIPIQYYSHFYRGLFDGDGSIATCLNRKKERYSATRASLAGTNGGLLFLMDFLIKNLKMKRYSVKDYKTHAVVNFSGDSWKFLDWIYKDSEQHMRLDRKYEHYLRDKKVYSEKWPTYTIRNNKTGEVFTTSRYTEFCREHNIGSGSLKRAFYHNSNGLTRGKWAGWELLSIKGRVPKGKVYL